jgi:GNAT superfamily N-acetyltransferase
MNSEVSYISVSAEQLMADHAWWDIYDEAFPSDEREPPQVIIQSLREHAGLAFNAHVNDKTLAIATTHLLKNPAAVFLVYLATARDLRGHGLGGELLEFAWRTSFDVLSNNGSQPTGLVLEVDALESSNDALERKVRERRMSFFRRHGLKLLPDPYKQPPVDGIASVTMSLMFRPADGQSEPDSDLVRALVRAIYFEKYYAINGISRESLNSLLGD